MFMMIDYEDKSTKHKHIHKDSSNIKFNAYFSCKLEMNLTTNACLNSNKHMLNFKIKRLPFFLYSNYLSLFSYSLIQKTPLF